MSVEEGAAKTLAGGDIEYCAARARLAPAGPVGGVMNPLPVTKAAVDATLDEAAPAPNRLPKAAGCTEPGDGEQRPPPPVVGPELEL